MLWTVASLGGLDTGARTLANPLAINLPTGNASQQWLLKVTNAFGSAIPAPTLDTLYVLTCPWVSPANGKSRLYQVNYDGTHFLISQLSTADF